MRIQPRIVFLIPIASARRAKDWDLACALFRQTLSSVSNSTVQDYCVVVAGHEAPDFQLPQHPTFKFLSLDHALPSLERGYWFAAVKDKMIKDEAGYLIKHGWMWRESARYFVQRTEHFDRVCGSCLIIRSDLADQTGPFLTDVEGAVLDETGSRFAAADQYSLIPGAGTGTLLLNDCHQRYAAQFAYLGHTLETVPFHAAVCCVGHGNNAGIQSRTQTARMFLGRVRRTRLVTPSLRKEFMLG